MVTWGNEWRTLFPFVQPAAKIVGIYSTTAVFAALDVDGKVTIWGKTWGEEDGHSIAAEGVSALFTNDKSFAAIKADGTIKSWGYDPCGGDEYYSYPCTGVDADLSGVTNVVFIFSTQQAFGMVHTQVLWETSS